MDAPTHDVWRTLLRTAVHAPSPHNVQPWRLRPLGPRDAELLIEKRRTLPQEDVTGSFIILTMGLFVETLRLVAAHSGLAVDDTLVHEPAWYAADRLASVTDELIPFARVTLRPDAAVRAGVPLERIAERRTSRLAYAPEPVTAAAVERLAALADEWGHRFATITDAARVERILAWNIDAVFDDLNHPPYRDELAGWIRYTHAQSARTRDGLDARCMNQAPLELWLAFHASAMLRWPVVRPWFRRRYRDQIGPVATLGLLDGPFWEPADAYATGRFLVHFWLEVTRLGYVLHPYGNLVTNRPTAARVAAATGLDRTWLAFKIGRSAVPPPSRRRTVEEVFA